MALSLKVGDEFGNFDHLKKQSVYCAISYVMCSITAIPVMCSTPAESTPSLLKELYHQWRIQEFVRGGRKSERIFFFAFQFFKGGSSSENSR